MTYPSFFEPTSTESFTVGDLVLQIPKSEVVFTEWNGAPISDTFGGKRIINHDGDPVFAELAIMRVFQDDGWDSRWVETYGKKTPICLNEWKDGGYRAQINCPFDDPSIKRLLAEIAVANGGKYSGCWDVVSKKGDSILFAESKRTKRDIVQPSQRNWFTAALNCGLTVDNFLMVQWDFRT